MKARIEFKREDCWVGVFWKHTWNGLDFARNNGHFDRNLRTTDVWVCIVPMFPLHLTFGRAAEEGGRA